MILRPATVADCAAILDIWNPVIRDTLVTFNSAEKSVAELEAVLAEKARADLPFFVAEVEGKVVGFATYGQFRGGVGYAHTMEHTVILSDGAWGRGIGRALMAEIEAHAARRGVHSMFAGVSAANEAGVGFHAAVGYLEVARLSEVGFKFGRWLDLVLMQKILVNHADTSV